MGCGGSKEPKSDPTSPSSVTVKIKPPGRGKGTWSPNGLLHAANDGAGGVQSFLKKQLGAPPAEKLENLAKCSEDEAAEWLRALAAGVDALWSPLLKRVDFELSADEAVPSWESLSTASLLKLLVREAKMTASASGEADCDDDGGGGEDGARWEHAAASERLLEMAAALWQRRCSRQPALNAEGFESASLRQLFAMLALALCRIVAVEGGDAFDLKLRWWRQVQRCFGLPRPQLCALLGGAEKGLLLYADAAVVGDGKLAVRCLRGSALWEALPQWEASAFGAREFFAGGSAKLFPRFGNAADGYEQGEGHGPRKELFELFGQQMLHGSAELGHRALLPYQSGARRHWFDTSRTRTTEDERLLRFAGWLMAQAVCNRAPLDVPLPLLLFAKLLAGGGFEPSLALLGQFDPAAADGLRKVKGLGDADFKAMLELEGEAGTDREAYVAAGAARLLVTDCGWQFNALREGFYRALPQALLTPLSLTPSQLASGVCGTVASADVDFKLRDVFRVVLDDELRECAPLSGSLWAVLDGWKPAQKRRLLKFATGSERLPAPGTELLSVQMVFSTVGAAELGWHAGMLPQAHTCDNVLELPNYYAALCARKGRPYEPSVAPPPELLKELRALIDAQFCTAVSACDEYGLDGDENAGSVRPPNRPMRATFAAPSAVSIDAITASGASPCQPQPEPPKPAESAGEEQLLELLADTDIKSPARPAKAGGGVPSEAAQPVEEEAAQEEEAKAAEAKEDPKAAKEAAKAEKEAAKAAAKAEKEAGKAAAKAEKEAAKEAAKAAKEAARAEKEAAKAAAKEAKAKSPDKKPSDIETDEESEENAAGSPAATEAAAMSSGAQPKSVEDERREEDELLELLADTEISPSTRPAEAAPARPNGAARPAAEPAVMATGDSMEVVSMEESDELDEILAITALDDDAPRPRKLAPASTHAARSEEAAQEEEAKAAEAKEDPKAAKEAAKAEKEAAKAAAKAEKEAGKAAAKAEKEAAKEAAKAAKEAAKAEKEAAKAAAKEAKANSPKKSSDTETNDEIEEFALSEEKAAGKPTVGGAAPEDADEIRLIDDILAESNGDGPPPGPVSCPPRVRMPAPAAAKTQTSSDDVDALLLELEDLDTEDL